MVKATPKQAAITRETRTSALASSRRPPPSAREIADAMPLPIPPPDMVCITISTGNTRLTAASASTPSQPTK